MPTATSRTSWSWACGLVGYVDGEPAGWVAVEPRESYPRIWARQKSWMRMDPDLEGVWSVTCFVVRKGFRRQGLMNELAAATRRVRQAGRRLRPRGLPHRAASGEDRDLGRGVSRAAAGLP